MIKNYLQTFWRQLVKNKVYSTINMLGLSVGLAGFIVILLYLNFELSYDTWHPSLKQVYKISEQTDEDIKQQTPAPLANFLREKLSQVEAATSIQPAGGFETLVEAQGKKIYEKDGVVADSSFFAVFPYSFAEGDPATAMNKPNAIVISQALSKKLFGSANPIGKTIKLYSMFENEITGVFIQPGKPSQLGVEFVYRSSYEKQSFWWENYSYQTYVKTVEGVTGKNIDELINDLYYHERLKDGNKSLKEFRASGHRAGLFVDELQQLHNFPKHGSSNFNTVSILLLLSVLLLLAGAINFSNLSIAGSIRRAKEVGVRKVLGSGQRQLLWRFIGEIALQCLLCLGLGIILVLMILPYFNSQFNIRLELFNSGDGLSIAVQVGLSLLAVILLSGLYPAVFLSRYSITKVLKGDYSTGKKGYTFRNALIVMQFAVAAFFITGTLVIKDQMYFMETQDKGFSGEQVIRLNALQKTREADFEVTRHTLMSIPGVQAVAKSTTVPGDAISDTSTQAFKHAGNEYRMVSVKVSDDYFNTLGIQLLKGRLFNNSYADENTRSVVLNEAAVQKLNIQNPLGAYISFPYCDTIPMQIVGIVKNFHVSDFANMVQPVAYTVGNKACIYQSGGALLVKINAANTHETLAAIERTWKTIEPDFPIRYSFLDENFSKLFSSYRRLQMIIGFFAFTAIFISVMGLFALSAFLIGQRSKEIAVRKILGAQIGNLGLLLSRSFIGLVVLGMFIALPVSWWATNNWLQTFAYRADIGWVTFVSAALIVIVIAAITIGVQALKATIANPVKSLRSE